MDWNQKLNPQQLEAVTKDSGPLLVLAGAGSGKTRVITHRIAWLISEKTVSPEHILALTFTNKAADEMSQRAVELLEKLGYSINPSDIQISTFHSLGARILRENAERVGLDWHFDIYDEDEQLQIIKRVQEAEGLGDSRAEAKAYRRYINTQKNAGISPREAIEEAFSDEEEESAQLYEEYQRALREANAVDFGDLILRVRQLLEEETFVADFYRDYWKHLLIDEFQDTNTAQYQLLNQLTGDEPNLTVVGDDDQSIYRWRGATVRNILEFEDDFPETDTVTLEQNYRSTEPILDAANDVISQNPNRREKELWTAKSEGTPVQYCNARDADEEASFVADKINRLRQDEDISDIAIIYRTNAQGRRFEEALRNKGTPYYIYGGMSFYEREEVKDILAYLKAALNPSNEVAFERAINTPKRGVGDVTLGKLSDARRLPVFDSYLDVISYVSSDSPDVYLQHQAGNKDLDLAALKQRKAFQALDGITGRPKGGIHTFKSVLDSLRERFSEEQSLGTVVRDLLSNVEYLDYLEQKKPEKSWDKRQNVFELIEALEDFEERTDLEELPDYGENAPEPVRVLKGFLEQASLTRDRYDQQKDRETPVTLMTAHAAKGLEFDTVFLVGMEDRLFPHRRSTENQHGDKEEIHEERRLVYVAMTRAQNRLYLTNAKRRRMYGKTRRTRPSRFLLDIAPKRLEIDSRSASSVVDYRTNPSEQNRTRNQTGYSQQFDASTSLRSEADEEVSPFPSYDEYDTDPTSRQESEDKTVDKNELVDATVSHSKFGMGKVQDVSFSGDDVLLRIEFPTAGEKTIYRRFVKVYG